MTITVRKAGIADVAPIHKLINGHAEKGVMLPRSLHSLYEHLRDYTVAVDGDDVVGVIGLHISWSDLAEIRSMAVATAHQGQSLGRRLVAEAIDEAVRLGIPKVFVLTYVPDFFSHLGFAEVDKAELPHKIWQECIHCPQFPDCGEVALTRTIEAAAAA